MLFGSALWGLYWLPLRLIREHVGMSYVALDGDEHAANRFYLENLAIGRMRPLLNMDVER